ncbi:hypothetical protein PISMIDRAFT_249262 [Pisolithus microcarpus 441]|uniref:Uncharacterized protein n=1 Tax=Pisolithus microcarpus 441 TaxID=765257 RepID=A0A0C9ZAE1_9AGAM|nr:hypothetical protein PISMIDRAFT_249262 [Pisolithus microcarpus 441]
MNVRLDGYSIRSFLPIRPQVFGRRMFPWKKKRGGGGWKWSHLTMYILPRGKWRSHSRRKLKQCSILETDRINITLSPLQKRLLPTQAYVGKAHPFR